MITTWFLCLGRHGSLERILKASWWYGGVVRTVLMASMAWSVFSSILMTQLMCRFPGVMKSEFVGARKNERCALGVYCLDFYPTGRCIGCCRVLKCRVCLPREVAPLADFPQRLRCCTGNVLVNTFQLSTFDELKSISCGITETATLDYT